MSDEKREDGLIYCVLIGFVLLCILWPLNYHFGSFDKYVGISKIVVTTLFTGTLLLSIFWVISAGFAVAYVIGRLTAKRNKGLVAPTASAIDLAATNVSVAVPIFHLFGVERREPVFSQIQRTTFNFNQGVVTLSPKHAPPGRQIIENEVLCPICDNPVRVKIVQYSVLPVIRDEVGGKIDRLQFWRAIMFRYKSLKVAYILMISFFLSPVVYVASMPHPPGMRPFLGAWGIAASLVGIAYLSYPAIRFGGADKTLLPIRSTDDFGYGDPACINIITHANIEPGTNVGTHVAFLGNGDTRQYTRKILMQQYGFRNTWLLLTP
jgi:hypothetical protein